MFTCPCKRRGEAEPPVSVPAAVMAVAVTAAVESPVVVNRGVIVGGVSLQYLERVVTSGFGQQATMTTFVEEWVKPRTVGRRESLLEMLARAEPRVVRETADVFVSHVWTYPLHETVAALKHVLLHQEGNDDDVFVWVDGVCVNQHLGSGEVTPEDLQTTFGESLRAIGKVAMVLMNWRDPSYAKRTWCVFEAYMTTRVPGVQVILAMSPSEEKNLARAMVENEVNAMFLRALFGSVNVERAQAREPRDQETILRLIREFGVANVNGVVLGSLKAWLVRGGDVALKMVENSSKELGNVLVARAALHDVLGEYRTALEYYDKALVVFIQVCGPEHQEMGAVLNNKALCLESLGRLQEALDVHEQALAIRIKALGPEHLDVVSSIVNRAECLKSMGKYEDALGEYDKVLATGLKLLPPNDKEVAIWLNNRAGCLRALTRYEEALPAYDQAVSLFKASLGEDHPNVAAALNNRAECLRGLGRFQETLVELEKVLVIFSKVYGPNHPTTATIINNMASCFSTLGRFQDALQEYDRVLAIRTQVLGQEHPDVAQSINNKAVCLWRMGNKDEARREGKQALAIAERVLGPAHPTTAGYRRDWGE